MTGSGSYVVGLDNGGTANKFTVMDRNGSFLIDRLVELPSRVTEGPAAAISALRDAFGHGWERLGGWADIIGLVLFSGLCFLLLSAARKKLD